MPFRFHRLISMIKRNITGKSDILTKSQSFSFAFRSFRLHLQRFPAVKNLRGTMATNKPQYAILWYFKEAKGPGLEPNASFDIKVVGFQSKYNSNSFNTNLAHTLARVLFFFRTNFL